VVVVDRGKVVEKGATVTVDADIAESFSVGRKHAIDKR